MDALLKQLNKSCFWDIDPEYPDEVKSAKLIIERVMNFGNIPEIQLLKNYYGEKEIKHALCHLTFIDPKTLNFVSLLF